jgi:hypothetical protein
MRDYKLIACEDIIAGFEHPYNLEKMCEAELCSFCYVERTAMMQRTPYSMYNERYKHRLEYIYDQCGLSGSTDIQPPPMSPPPPKQESYCLSNMTMRTKHSDTCDSIAKEHKLSSAALYMNNQPAIQDCNSIPTDTELCLPPSCEETYILRPEDTGRSIEETFYDKTRGLPFGSLLRTYNPWISSGNANLRNSSSVYGCVLCLSPQNGVYNKGATSLDENPAISAGRVGQTWAFEAPPEDCDVAKGTTVECGKWHEAREDDSCAKIAVSNGITSKLLLAANPSLGTCARECEENLRVGKSYCVQPRYG